MERGKERGKERWGEGGREVDRLFEWPAHTRSPKKRTKPSIFPRRCAGRMARRGAQRAGVA